MDRRSCSIQSGFTLIEVMVVAVVIAILAAVAIPAYQNHISESRTRSAENAAGAITSFCSSCLNSEGTLTPGTKTGDASGSVSFECTTAEGKTTIKVPKDITVTVTVNEDGASGRVEAQYKEGTRNRGKATTKTF